MSSHHHEGDSKSFILPVFMSFAIVFCLFVLMSRCSGPYIVPGSHEAAHTEHGTEHKSEHAAPTHEIEHKTADSTAHSTGDTAIHKTETHSEEHH